MNKFLFGSTESGDAGLDFSWVDKLNTVQAVNLITKNVNDNFINKLLDVYSTYKNIILHVTCTGFGGTKIEPNVPTMFQTHNKVMQLIHGGFPSRNIVLRVDPIVPTEKGIKSALSVLELFKNTGIVRVRYSFLDMYKHVKERFIKNNINIPYESFNAPKYMQENCVNALEQYSNFYAFESCAEYTKHKLGCISERDFNILNIDSSYIENSSFHNRSACGCCSNKKELLNHKSQCPHGCLYCYWKQNHIYSVNSNNVKKGRLFLTGITNINDFNNINNRFFIVKSCKNAGSYIKKGWRIVPQLAPNETLFFKYLKIRKEGNWNIESFNCIYKPDFLKQLEINLATKKALKDVATILDNGQDVVFMCYCNDLNLCHRKLLGEYYAKLGYKVIFN